MRTLERHDFAFAEETQHFLVLSAKGAHWAVPASAVERIATVQESSSVIAHEVSDALGFDKDCGPARVVEVKGGSRLVGLLAFGAVQIASCKRTEIVAAPALIKNDPAGQLVSAVILQEGVALAWVLDTNVLQENGGGP